MTATIGATETTGPLSSAQQREVAAAHERAGKIRKAARIAGFNGWVAAILAIASGPFMLLSLSGFLTTIGLSVVAYNEFQGRRRLLEFDDRAPARLGWNQLGLLALVVAYCGWRFVVEATSDHTMLAQLEGQVDLSQSIGGMGINELYVAVLAAFFGLTVLLSVVFQGLNAWYYFSRRPLVEAYRRETPAWVLQLQRLTTPSA